MPCLDKAALEGEIDQLLVALASKDVTLQASMEQLQGLHKQVEALRMYNIELYIYIYIIRFEYPQMGRP